MPTQTIDRETGARRFSRIVLTLYFILSIFEPYLTGRVGSVTKYYIFFVIAVLIYESRGLLRIRPYTWVYVAWLVWKGVTLLWSEDLATPKAHLVSQLGMVLFLAVLFSMDWDEVTLRWIERVSWLASGALGVIGLFSMQAYHGRVAARQVIVVAGVEIDPNNQAVLLLVGIVISLLYLFYHKRYYLLSIAIILINTYGCFQSGSRGGVITLVVLAVICILLPEERQSTSTKLWKLAALGVIVAVTVIASRRLLSEEIYQRLFDFGGYDDGSGRSKMWRNVWNVYTTDLLTVFFGIGWGSAATHTGTQQVVHNTFLTMLCDVGLFGTVLFFWPVVRMVRALIRERDIFPVLLAVGMLVPSFFLDAINKRFFWNAIFILGMYNYYYSGQKQEADRNPS